MDSPLSEDANPYKARKSWPPDFTKLTERQQFYFERKYRRRCKIKYQPQGWRQGTRAFQIGGSVAIFVFAVFLYDWKVPDDYKGRKPFERTRGFFTSSLDSMWSKQSVRRSVDAADVQKTDRPEAKD